MGTQKSKKCDQDRIKRKQTDTRLSVSHKYKNIEEIRRNKKEKRMKKSTCLVCGVQISSFNRKKNLKSNESKAKNERINKHKKPFEFSTKNIEKNVLNSRRFFSFSKMNKYQ